MVDAIEASTVRCEMLAQAIVHRAQIGLRIQSESDATLIGYDDDLASGAVEAGDRFLNTGQDFELFPRSYEASAGRIPVQHSVPI